MNRSVAQSARSDTCMNSVYVISVRAKKYDLFPTGMMLGIFWVKFAKFEQIVCLCTEATDYDTDYYLNINRFTDRSRRSTTFEGPSNRSWLFIINRTNFTVVFCKSKHSLASALSIPI